MPVIETDGVINESMPCRPRPPAGLDSLTHEEQTTISILQTIKTLTGLQELNVLVLPTCVQHQHAVKQPQAMIRKGKKK
jgi:hypothetical protein